MRAKTLADVFDVAQRESSPPLPFVTRANLKRVFGQTGMQILREFWLMFRFMALSIMTTAFVFFLLLLLFRALRNPILAQYLSEISKSVPIHE
jgi:hypothetical protein